MEEFLSFLDPGIPLLYLTIITIISFSFIIYGIKRKSINNKIRFISGVLFIYYLIILLSSTIIFREETANARVEMIPFWTYQAVINHEQGVSFWEIILNIILFIPFGTFISLLFPKCRLIQALFIGITLSALIEFCQFFFSLGIAQFDDIMHNSIGCIIGYRIGRYSIRVLKNNR